MAILHELLLPAVLVDQRKSLFGENKPETVPELAHLWFGPFGYVQSIEPL
jgi:hypothetical protein